MFLLKVGVKYTSEEENDEEEEGEEL